MVMKKIFLLLLFALGINASLLAQGQTTFTYSIGFGTGDLGDFIGQPSFRGFTLDYRHMVQPNIAVGFDLGWNVFYEEKGSQTYNVDNQSLTGKQYRYSNNFPMLATGTYFLKPEETLNPYAGLGLGTMFTRRNTDMNLYTLEQEAWSFALQPEIGFQYEVAPQMALTAALKYYVGFKAGDLDSDQSYLALNLGFTFK